MQKYIGKRVLARGLHSGVYFGTLNDKDGQEVELTDVRNIWQWEGANTLLDLAANGVKYPEKCHFSNYVENLVLTDVCEIVPCTKKAIKRIEGVPEWVC